MGGFIAIGGICGFICLVVLAVGLPIAAIRSGKPRRVEREVQHARYVDPLDEKMREWRLESLRADEEAARKAEKEELRKAKKAIRAERRAKLFR